MFKCSTDRRHRPAPAERCKERKRTNTIRNYSDMKAKQTLPCNISPMMEYDKDIACHGRPVCSLVNCMSGISAWSAMDRCNPRGFFLLTFLLLAFFSFGQTEICGNGLDDDGNGLADGLDPACYTASSEVIAAGSYIVNMGVEPQTESNALKPYGMVWELIHDHQVPIKWAINPGKGKDGIDFTYNGTAFKGGPFIISAEYRTAAVNAVIANWESNGVVGVTTTSDFTAPIERTINYSMNWTLDVKNGKIAEKYLLAAGVPNSAYNWVLPQDLSCCNDVFVIPHADPTWDNHSELLYWNDNGANGGCRGAIWAGCKAVSEMENIQNPLNPSERLNFLMLDPIAPDNNPAVWSDDHSDGTLPYTYDYDNHPIMQFLGTFDGAQENGAEQVYLPTNDWRPTTHIGVFDPDHPDMPSLSSGPAAKLAFGYAFGDTGRGYVVYEAAHKVNKNNGPENIAAQRAFLNFSFMAVGNKAIKPSAAVPAVMASGQSYALSGSATGGSGNYFYEWTSTCGGSFSNPYAAATTFTAPSVSSNLTCTIKLIVTDDCGTRVGFENVVIEIKTSPEICDNGIDDDGDGSVDLDDTDCQCQVPIFSFQNGSLVSGPAKSPGAVYSFSEVIPGVDALVSIVSFSHNDIVLLSLDEPAATNGGYDWAFQPIIDYNWLNGGGNYDPAGDKSVTFRFDFVDAASGDPVNVPLMHMTAVDVDGNSSDIREFVETSGFKGYYTQSPSDLTLSGALRALGPTWAFNGVVETALTSMISFEYEDASSVTLTYGGTYDGTQNHDDFSEGRMNCLYFKCYDFNTAVTCPSVSTTGGGDFCVGEPVVLTATVANGTGTCAIQWQSSPDGANWSDIAGARSLSHSVAATFAPQYFRAAYYCDGEPTCGTVYSAIDTVLVTTVGCAEICDNGFDDDGDGLTDGDDPDCTELEFCTYNLKLDFNETFNIRDFVRSKNPANPAVDWSQVSFTYTGAGANDPTSPVDWHLSDFNNGLDVTVTAADAAPGTGNTGDGRYRIYLVRNGMASYDDKMTIRIEDGNSNSASSLCFPPEICDNGLDDDGDGQIDGDDPDCPCTTRVTDGLLVLYDFKKGSGATVVDRSGTGTALDLTIGNTSNTTWLNECGLGINAETILQSSSPATKIIDGIKTTNKITIEAWVKPGNSTQGGPARIVTLSDGAYNRNFTLGQEGGSYVTRMRTTGASDNGTPTVYSTGYAVINSFIQHVIYTWDGATGNEKIVVDGIERYSGVRSGSTSNWDDTYRIAVANEIGASRDWLGEVYLVAVYDKVLTSSEIEQNFSAGYCCGKTNEPEIVCGDFRDLEIVYEGLKNKVPIALNITDVATVDSIAVEIAYKGNNPGSTITVQDAAGNTYSANKEIVGGIYIYRFTLPATTSISYTNQTNEDKAQSIIAYVFRSIDGGKSIIAQMTEVGGYNTTIPIGFYLPTSESPKNVTVKLPVTELTYDNRILNFTATAGSVTTSFTKKWGPSGIGFPNDCCVDIVEIQLANVTAPFMVVEVESPSGNGQSFAISGTAIVEVNCSPNEEICGNGLDDDGDGLSDCEDPDCGGSISLSAATPDPNICPGASTTLTTHASGGTLPYQFNWSDGIGTGSAKTVSPLENTTYTVTLTDANGCSATSQVSVNIKGIPSVIPDPNITICSGDTVTIQAVGADGAFSYFWDQGLGNGPLHQVSPTDNTVYSVTVTNTFGCQSVDNVAVIVNPLPLADAGGDVNLCTGFYTTITASASGALAPYSFTWDNGLGTGSSVAVNPSATSTYSVTVESANGCLASDEVTVLVEPCVEDCSNGVDDDNDGLVDCDDPDCGATVDLGPDVSICEGANTVIAASVSGGAGVVSYAWSNGYSAQSQTVTPSLTTTYSVTVTSPSGCTATDAVTVSVAVCGENCTNGIDDDGDGLVDCDDPDCIANAAPHLADDAYTSCPGMLFSERVTYNDANLQDPVFSIYSNPVNGTASIDATGKVIYTPFGFFCTPETFMYQVCNQVSGCCAQATVTIDFGDSTAPLLDNVPADITINCDDIVPTAPTVTAFDECPGIYMDYAETTDQFVAGGCETFAITRTWTATDFCGNVATGTQTITVVDQTAPEIFQVYTLASGQRVVAGVAKRVTQEWKYIPFPITFNGTPMVFTTVNSENDISAVAVRQRNQYSQGFQLRLSEEEANDGKHKPEDIAWVAIEQGVNTGQMNLDVGRWENVDHNVVQKFYSSQFQNNPALIASIQSSNDLDPANLRFRIIGKTAVNVYVQEETSNDAETAHGLEHVGYMAFDPGADLVSSNNEVFGETGRLNLTNAWATIELGREYTKPVVIFGGISSNDSEGVDFRVRNVTANSFQVRLQEWDYLDGSHAVESASYIVVEGSIPGDFDYYCSGSADKLQIGVNVFAMDNCDYLAPFDYSETSSLHAVGSVTERTWSTVDACGNTSEVTRFDTCTSAALRVKALLYGAMLNSNSALMRDDLRASGLIPAREPYSKLPAFPHVEDFSQGFTTTGNGNAGPATVEICHKPGTNAQKTLTINESALNAHLAHGDVLGTCGNSVTVTNDYVTVSDGDWNAASTWQGGNIPPVGTINNKNIEINHVVVLNSGNITINANTEFRINNGALTINTGDFQIRNASAFLNGASFSLKSGELTLTDPNAELFAQNCTITIGSNLKCNQGETWMENVLLNVNGFFENWANCSMVNMAGVINSSFDNFGSGVMTVLNTEINVKNGNLTNAASAIVNGDSLVVWLENGDLKNDGSWNAPIVQYCVSASTVGLDGSLPVSQDCAGLADYFMADQVLLVSDTTASGNGSSLTPEEIAGQGTINPARFAVSGDNAIVDWVLLEIRDPSSGNEILAYATVAMQRNGQLISEDGDEVIQFPELSEGNYQVAVRHRNHLGLITSTPVLLSSDEIPDVDFTDVNFPVKGGVNAGRILDNVRYLWAGDFNEDGQVIYQGPYNDVFHLFSRVLGDDANEGYLANFIIEDYDLTDYNLDGKCIYQGPNNDRASMLYHTILTHTTNSGFLANFIVLSNLP